MEYNVLKYIFPFEQIQCFTNIMTFTAYSDPAMDTKAPNTGGIS